MKHVLVARVALEPGLPDRVAGMLHRRAIPVDCLTTARSETPHVARVTIVVDSVRVSARRVTEHLRQLVPVLHVEDVTGQPLISRELALMRVRCPENARARFLDLAALASARIVDETPDSVMVEVTGDSPTIDALAELLAEWEILEMVRTGPVVLRRGRDGSPDDEREGSARLP